MNDTLTCDELQQAIRNNNQKGDFKVKAITDRNAPWQSIKDASYSTGMSQYYIRQGIANGDIPHIRSGSKFLVNVPRLLEKLEQQAEAETAVN